MIHDLKKQGLSLTAITRKMGCDRKTVRKYLERGLEAPAHVLRQPRVCLLDPYKGYLRECMLTLPDLSGARLTIAVRGNRHDVHNRAINQLLGRVR